ncbi:hypothetical protein [Streptomyces griseofuscus]|uniref:hypothetical protein n=1 Tax=Streptomyces griseofuscus TaxID=146922 RepID=UPI00382463CC
MDAQGYNAALTELRTGRDKIKKVRADRPSRRAQRGRHRRPCPTPAPETLAADISAKPPAEETAESSCPPQPAAVTSATGAGHQQSVHSTAPLTPAVAEASRSLPSIPEGRRATTVFLDTATGVLVHRDQTHRLDLGDRSAGATLTAIFRTIPGTERIYITAGDPWHQDADRATPTSATSSPPG